jgi:hypothetical protein
LPGGSLAFDRNQGGTTSLFVLVMKGLFVSNKKRRKAKVRQVSLRTKNEKVKCDGDID